MTKRYDSIEFGYDDGRADTVMVRKGPASVTIEGQDLENMAAAVLHLQGYAVQPGLRKLGLRKYKNCRTTTITDQRMSIRKGTRGPLHFSVSKTDGYSYKTDSGRVVNRKGTALWIWAQSTVNPSFHMNFVLSKEESEEFGRRLAESAEWELTG